MKLKLERTNIFFLIILVLLIVSGLYFMAFGNENISTKLLYLAAIMAPVSLALKGIEFILENRPRKAFMSILLLSVVCILALLFVFV